MKKKTYTLSPDGRSITCLLCNETSYLQADVENLYCSRCRVFHDLHLTDKPSSPDRKGKRDE